MARIEKGANYDDRQDGNVLYLKHVHNNNNPELNTTKHITFDFCQHRLGQFNM